MDFNFTEEQVMLRDAFAQFAKEEIAPHAAEWDAEDRVPMEIVPKLGEM
ncbi:MAG: acyl-CoA dehydrogenase family protein, partial [bacterium]